MVAESKDNMALFLPQYSIGKAAKLLGISVHTLRMYEREGIILLAKSATNQRRLSEWDLERIRCIRKVISEDKFSIPAIRRILSFIPCWRIKNCPSAVRESCPASSSHSEPCWTLKNKLEPCKSDHCHSCSVYVSYADCHSLKHTLFHFVESPAPSHDPSIPFPSIE